VTETDTATPLLSLRNIKKFFGAVEALKGVSFDVYPGEIIALVGDNGAGKSTLVKIISGVYGQTSGELYLEGKLAHISSPADALRAGIETVYQDLALIEQLDVADNIYLGRELYYGGWIGSLLGLLDRRRMREATAVSLSQLHIKIPKPTLGVKRMSGGQRQAVAIGRGITWGRKLLLLDEPTAALGVEEREQVLRLVERVNQERGMTLLIISHNMQDVHRLADRIVVLRQGNHHATLVKTEVTPTDIVAYITGAL
jgi:simple sugar transport system ATP-binding protein